MTLISLEAISPPQFDCIPDELKGIPQWTLWGSREQKGEKGIYYSKEPISLNGRFDISWTNKRNMHTFEEVKAAYEKGGGNGIGLILTHETPYVCVDIDDQENIHDMETKYHNIAVQSYAEISPSGNGLHVWFKGNKPTWARTKKNGIEFFGGQNKFVTFTGNVFSDMPINDNQKVINHIGETFFPEEAAAAITLQQKKSPNLQNEGNSFGKLSDNEVVELIRTEKPGRYKVYQGDFSDYPSQSEAVLALMNELAYYTGKDIDQMRSIYDTSSATYADPKKNENKFARTADRAIRSTMNVYKAKVSNRSVTDSTTSVQDSELESFKSWWHINPNGTKTFLHSKLAEQVLAEYAIVRYPTAHGSLYYYNAKKGIYEEDTSTTVIQGIIRNMDKENLKSQHIREVYQYVEQLSQVVGRLSETHIAVGNGHLNLETCELEPFSNRNFVLQKIPTNYNESAQSTFVDDTLNKVTKWHVPSIENIKEMFACVLYPKILVPKMFYLYGRTAHNGKSSVLNMIHQTFNKDGGNVSAVSPQKLANNTFAGASIYGKMANIVDDQPDQLIEDSGTLKTIITGGYVEIERKGKDSETVKMETTMITASNYFPNFRESGKQINRRLHIIPFEHDFSTDQTRLSDSESMQLISSTETAEYVLKLAVHKLKQMLQSQHADKLTPNEKADSIAETFAQQSDPLNDYFDEFGESYFNETPGTNVIAEYEQWCMQNRVTPLGNKRFKERVCTQYNMEWKQKRVQWNGKTTSCKGFKSIES